MLECCEASNLVLTNTYYQHKEAHKFTREQPSRNKKSIIDEIVMNRNQLKCCLDVKMKRQYEIDSDHFMVMARIKFNTPIDLKITSSKSAQNKMKIKSYKLRIH